MITMRKYEVCPLTWCHIHRVSKAIYYKYKEKTLNKDKPEYYGNLGVKKLQMHTLQATATFQLLVNNELDTMPHKTRTFESR